MGRPVELQMPERIAWTAVARVLRELGFTPHQVQSLTISYEDSSASPFVQVVAGVNNQRVTRRYDTGSPSGVRIVALPDSEEAVGE